MHVPEVKEGQEEPAAQHLSAFSVSAATSSSSSEVNASAGPPEAGEIDSHMIYMHGKSAKSIPLFYFQAQASLSDQLLYRWAIHPHNGLDEAGAHCSAPGDAALVAVDKSTDVQA